MILHSDVKNLLSALHFSLEEGAARVWVKAYAVHSDYRIKVDFAQEEINYGDKIRLGDKTTCNFKAAENFVVLECVNRLLEKGYAPECIILEKDYPLGHKLKGKLDVLVTGSEDKAYLIIECKTWGNEYEKAVKKTLSNGGQLLSYFQQDKSAQYLCLYTSRLEGNRIQSEYGIIKVEPEFVAVTNTEEVFEHWNKNLRDNGIFETISTPYNIVIKAITKGRLIPLTKDDSSRIFNQFAEILRHNVVSDKPNAFNKLITLLLCKIVDEDRGEEEELYFQWLETDDNKSLQKRLSDLYKKGMDEYLSKKITDYSDKEVDDKFYELNATQREEIKFIITKLRLEKNNEFAFKEVFNTSSFEDNGKVLKEVVELLQPYKVRYNRKQQFLGDFFELLLNTSIKQEAGQFFTPVPIARFIINSLPLKEIILSKIDKGDTDFLPYVIDYAVGSGHFLTEAMDEIHAILADLNKETRFKPSVRNRIRTWIETEGFHYDWAYDFIYGIEKDYRLVKTAKVSCFLNGDGLARIFNADGLANFQTDDDYKDKLKQPARSQSKDNQQFEVLIANPPYSVSAFKNTLKDGAKSFDLYNRLTEDSSEIECLFIERAKQLLKDGGYAGIILPSSILSNSGIYENAREIILKYFRLVAITEFGSGTFMATGTNTVTLFLERRNNTDWQKIEHAVNTFFTNTTDVACNGIEAPFSRYVAHVYETISLEDYASFVRQKPNEAILKHELFVDYRKAFDNSTPVKNLKKKNPFKALSVAEQEAELNRLFLAEVNKTEKEKLLYFILAYPQKTLLVKANPSGKNEDEKEFLGYEFSNRRGHEGIKAYGARTIQQATRLYDEDSSLNPEKVNTYIYNAFLKKETVVSESLQNNISYQQLVDMLNFERVEFTKSVSTVVKKKGIDYTELWGTDKLVALNDVATILKGTSIAKAETKTGVVPVVAGGKEPAYFHNVANRTGPVITVSASGANAGFINFFTENVFASDCNTVQSKDENKISTKLLYHLLEHLQPIITNLQRGQAQPHVYASDLEKIRIPLLSVKIQNELLEELTKNKAIQDELTERRNNRKEDIFSFVNLKGNSSAIKLGSICEVKGGKRVPLGHSFVKKNNHPYIRVIDFENYSISIKGLKYISDETFKLISSYTISKDDIYISIAGTIGLVGLVPDELNNKSLTENAAKLIIKNKEEVNKKYLMYCLASHDVQHQIQDRIKILGTPKLALNRIETIEVRLPNIDDQNVAVHKIESTEQEIRVCELELKDAVFQKKFIFKKISAKSNPKFF